MENVWYCPACFTEIPEDHFTRRAYHDDEHCPRCNNDLMGGKWYNNVITKEKALAIQEILRKDEIV
jgi:hypothetical protein